MFHFTTIRLFILAITLVGFGGSLQAQTPEPTSKQVAIQEFIKLIGATQVARTMFVTMIEQYAQTLSSSTVKEFEKKNLSPVVKEKMNELARDFHARLAQRLSEELPTRLQYDDRLNRLYLDVYDQHFDEAEIREMIAFYKSAVGQKFLGFGPKVSASLQERFRSDAEAQILSVTREIVDEEVKRLETRALIELNALKPQKRTN